MCGDLLCGNTKPIHLDYCNDRLILILPCSCPSWVYCQLMNDPNSAVLSKLRHESLPTPGLTSTLITLYPITLFVILSEITSAHNVTERPRLLMASSGASGCKSTFSATLLQASSFWQCHILPFVSPALRRSLLPAVTDLQATSVSPFLLFSVFPYACNQLPTLNPLCLKHLLFWFK